MRANRQEIREGEAPAEPRTVVARQELPSRRNRCLNLRKSYARAGRCAIQSSVPTPCPR
jgi:hypothetical protein